MLKDRHIDQMKQDALRGIIPKIYWEKNTLVNHNPDIPASQIISKSKTSDFPAEAITVRTHSQKRKVATVYFYGEEQTRTYGNSHTWTYVDEQLRVTLPMIGHNKKQYSYSFQGQLPRIFTLDDMAWVLDYIQDQFDTMTGDNFGHFVGKHAKYQTA